MSPVAGVVNAGPRLLRHSTKAMNLVQGWPVLGLPEKRLGDWEHG